MMNRASAILLIDGHEGVRNALARRLAREPGIGSVDTASDLDDALKQARSRCPDVVLIDPNTLGAEPGEVIRAVAALGKPVVVLTASMLGQEEWLLRGAGATAVLLKGAPIAELLQVLEQLRGATAQGTPGL